MIMIAGHLPGVPLPHLSLRFTKPIPDGSPTAVFLISTLDLIGRGSGAPEKILGKRVHGFTLPNPPQKESRGKPYYEECRISGPVTLTGPGAVEFRKTNCGSTWVELAASEGS